MFKKGRRKGTVRFTLAPTGETRKAFVAGDFTGWAPLAMRKRSGVFGVTVSLPSGRYQYKFILDGLWVKDPDNSDWAASDMGTINSLAVVD
jgi:1,4-alpha-glucan branching enzyme